MSNIKKYQLPVYDPPATYTDFTGGINTSLSNESLQPNELRDGLNCHYSNSALVNRPGASLIKRLVIPLTTDRYQGDFVFAGKKYNWFISVRNGHIFYGLYLDNQEEINMSLLNINLEHTSSVDDVHNYIIGLPYVVQDIDYTQTHEGFIYQYSLNKGMSDEEERPVKRIYVKELPEEPVKEDEGEYSTWYLLRNNSYTDRFVYDEYAYRLVDPEVPGVYDWADVGQDFEPEHETLIIQNTRRVQGIPVTFKNLSGEDEVCFLMATGTRLIKIKEAMIDEEAFLYGEILSADTPNAWEYKNIGVNNLSPFPNYLIEEVTGAPSTEIGYIMTNYHELALDQTNWTFSAIISCLTGYDKADFYYKWEVKKKNVTDWQCIWWWNASKNNNQSSKGKWTIDITKAQVEAKVGTLQAGDELLIRCTLTDKFSSMYSISDQTYIKELDEDGDYVSQQADAIYSKTHVTKRILSTYAPTENDADVNFLKIHSSTKIIADGQKALIYDSAPVYNSAEWFKTVISNYNYITYNGSLDFKTTKNEKIIGVVVFDTSIVVFSDNDQLGGNISVVTGNGDDYNDGSYYSPYKRNIANTNVSCDAYNSIQVMDNYIIFKYRKDIYILDTNGLSNTDTVKVETINDMVKQRLNNIEFPLDRVREPRENEHLEYDFHELRQCLKPDEIFSEVVDGYYGLIFPNQGFFIDTLETPTNTDKYYEGAIEKYQDTLIENVSLKPGIRWKCYIRDGHLYQGYSKTLYPWLRDVSYLFDICSVLYIEGIPYFVRKNGDLITFNNYDGVSYIQSDFKLRFKSKAYDMDAPALCKFLDNLCIYYNRDFNNLSYLNVWVHNEAAYELYGPENEAYITLISGETDQVRYNERIKFDDALNLRDKDKPIEKYEDHVYIDPMEKPVEILNSYYGVEDDEGNWVNPVLNRPSYTSKTFVPRWRFPWLSAQVTIELRINQGFSISALNFSYTTSDMPDFTREKLYREIIRNNYK